MILTWASPFKRYITAYMINIHQSLGVNKMSDSIHLLDNMELLHRVVV